MTRVLQQRTIKTRARLIAAAQEIVADQGFDALRVEDVVKSAGVAKGTFFAHFRDKDALMDRLIGDRIDAEIDAMVARPLPRDVQEMVDHMLPLLTFMTSERYVFDLIFRYSGAAAEDEIGAIAMTFGRQLEVFSRWIEASSPRSDVPVAILAEGVQAFAVQAMSLRFCALHHDHGLRDPLKTYLTAWLTPSQPSA